MYFDIRMASSSSTYTNERKRLYKRFAHHYRSQYINYEKYYLASDCIKTKGKVFDWATTLVAAILLILISGAVRGLEASIIDVVILLLSAAVAALSFATAIGGWKRLASEYYKAGQIHDDLYSEFDKMVKERLPDPNEDDKELKKDCEMLLKRKEELNKATPQLASKWYYRLMERDDGLEWEEKSLTDLKGGDSSFYDDDVEMDGLLKFKRFVVWVLI